MPEKEILIPILGKGATNHLHRRELVELFSARGIRVRYAVRDDYVSMLERIPGAAYTECVFPPMGGFRAWWIQTSQFARIRYPAKDIARRYRYEVAMHDLKGWRSRLLPGLLRFLARYRFVMELLVRVENWILGGQGVELMEPVRSDGMLLLGVGASAELECRMDRWAAARHLPVIHFIGNYDNLTSHGFRGFPVNHLIVWGESMTEDAVQVHGIPASRLTQIGSLRYNMIHRETMPARQAALASVGLDPRRKTILFAGFMIEYHYFEMLDVLDELHASGTDCQLILRVYPNKQLVNSVIMKALANEAARRNVYVSWGDSHRGSGAREILQIEESELWSLLNASDLVINMFSSISLEACIFDKPAINMWYFPPPTKVMVGRQEYINYSLNIHNRRMESYGAIPRAENRAELVKQIRLALEMPEARRAERARVVEKECGCLDGRAGERLVDACIKEFRWQG